MYKTVKHKYNLKRERYKLIGNRTFWFPQGSIKFNL